MNEGGPWLFKETQRKPIAHFHRFVRNSAIEQTMCELLFYFVHFFAYIRKVKTNSAFIRTSLTESDCCFFSCFGRSRILLYMHLAL